MRFERIRYKIRDICLGVRYWIILKLIGKMPVIVNCTIYNDVMEYNFGKTRTYKPCVCFNNIVRNFDKMVDLAIKDRAVYTGGDAKISRKKNAFILF